MFGRQDALADADSDLGRTDGCESCVFNDTLRRAYPTRQGQHSLKDPKTRIEVEDWEVVADPLMLLGKTGIQELEGTQLGEARIQEVELTETQLGKAGIQELDVMRTPLVLKSTVVAAPTNPSGDKSRV